MPLVVPAVLPAVHPNCTCNRLTGGAVYLLCNTPLVLYRVNTDIILNYTSRAMYPVCPLDRYQSHHFNVNHLISGSDMRLHTMPSLLCILGARIPVQSMWHTPAYWHTALLPITHHLIKYIPPRARSHEEQKSQWILPDFVWHWSPVQSDL